MQLHFSRKSHPRDHTPSACTAMITMSLGPHRSVIAVVVMTFLGSSSGPHPRSCPFLCLLAGLFLAFLETLNLRKPFQTELRKVHAAQSYPLYPGLPLKALARKMSLTCLLGPWATLGLFPRVVTMPWCRTRDCIDKNGKHANQFHAGSSARNEVSLMELPDTNSSRNQARHLPTKKICSRIPQQSQLGYCAFGSSFSSVFSAPSLAAWSSTAI